MMQNCPVCGEPVDFGYGDQGRCPHCNAIIGDSFGELAHFGTKELEEAQNRGEAVRTRHRAPTLGDFVVKLLLYIFLIGLMLTVFFSVPGFGPALLLFRYVPFFTEVDFEFQSLAFFSGIAIFIIEWIIMKKFKKAVMLNFVITGLLIAAAFFMEGSFFEGLRGMLTGMF